MATDRAAKKQPPSASIRDVQRDRENSHEVCPMALEFTSTAREKRQIEACLRRGLWPKWQLAPPSARWGRRRARFPARNRLSTPLLFGWHDLITPLF